MELRYQIGDELRSVQVDRSGDQYTIRIGDQSYSVAVSRSTPDEIAFTVDGQPRRAVIAADGQRRYIAFDANVFVLDKADSSKQARRNIHGGENTLTATMHGQVVKVLTAEGEAVTRGQTLILLEAMKMEIRIAAPHDGHVAKLRCSEGQVVERGQVLVELSR
ncbi:MAG: acetyl-CoA carboxylase biotin carboxyl carrier protein subunit [Anaerolineae bacterium]|nr:acetyl-CoA carboxylase biotin carboxyl carrier protein subunit [Anaerolineae bacterium]